MENPTYFSNEYATDLMGDKWMAVAGNTKLANCGYAPNDLRPTAEKRQYIDLTTLDPSEPGFLTMRGDDAPSSSGASTVGQYKVATIWMNVRQDADTTSPILARVTTNTTMQVVAVQSVGNGKVRGLTAHGGWITISAAGYWERIGDLDMAGEYRMVAPAPAPILNDPLILSSQVDKMQVGQEFECQKQHLNISGDIHCQLSTGKWVLVYSKATGLMAELKLKGYNDKERRRPIKDRFGHQMMLVSDMVLRWDDKFSATMKLYASDDGGEELLKKEFGEAYKRLTELGCPWSNVTVTVV